MQRRLVLHTIARRNRTPPFLSHRCVSKLTGPSSSIDDSISAAELRDKILKAPFERVGGGRQTLFPWRHSEELLDRLIPGTEDYFQKGNLLAKGFDSNSVNLDAFVTAFVFLGISWSDVMFFKQWKRDLADDVAFAFSQGVKGILSNSYQVPFDSVDDADGNLRFDHTLTQEKGDDDDKHPDGGPNPNRTLPDNDLTFMVESKLRELYESASRCGKDKIQVRLETKPTGNAHLLNLFVLPGMSRRALKREPRMKSKYEELMGQLAVSYQDAMPVYKEIMLNSMEAEGGVHSTVICQVLVQCDEVFRVRDLNTGATIQGYEDEKFREVLHLVRMEMEVEFLPSKGAFLGIELRRGNWQITDIDDLLDGNLII